MENLQLLADMHNADRGVIRDGELRIWERDSRVYVACGHSPDSSIHKTENKLGPTGYVCYPKMRAAKFDNLMDSPESIDTRCADLAVGTVRLK